jgi:hypothetical protein
LQIGFTGDSPSAVADATAQINTLQSNGDALAAADASGR